MDCAGLIGFGEPWSSPLRAPRFATTFAEHHVL